MLYDLECAKIQEIMNITSVLVVALPRANGLSVQDFRWDNFLIYID